MGATFAPSVLDAAGPQAAHIENLWWLMFWLTTAVFILVIAFLIYAVIRGRRGMRAEEPLLVRPEASSEARLTRGVGSAVAVTIILLFVVLVATIRTSRAMAALQAPSAVTVSLVGHQWWWEVEYEDSVASQRVRTANEIHVPVGQPVVFKVTSHDVNHSFWVPNLSGKRDLIPGYTTAIWLQADRPGVYRGQCAEYCGYQHAKMGLLVVAESKDEFDRWLTAQRGAAAENPPDPSAARGREVFLSSTCVMCHTIRGTSAGATLGPDLTHLATRRTIAAGTLTTSREHLLQWLRDAQRVKPGTHMPSTRVAPEDLDAVVAYLESLT